MKVAPRIEVVCIGTELLTDKVNTHTVFLGGKLASVGLPIAREQTVGDHPSSMEHVFREAWTRGDVVLSCGGLGPTFDDITREIWSKVLRRPLKLDPRLVADIKEKFRMRGIPMPPKNKRQGFLLKGAQAISNSNGTAPGQYLVQGKKILILLPGPARELYPMVEEFVLPRLAYQYSSRHLVGKNFFSVGIPESKIDQMIRPLVSAYARVQGCRVTHGILASQSIITVKFSVEGNDLVKTERAAAFLADKFRRRLGPAIFGEDDDTLSGVIGNLLRSRNKKLAVAESCTGGLIAKLITDQPGASDYFMEGVISYSNRSKQKRLGVSPLTLDKRGAVSKEAAIEMAQGLRKNSGADYTLSVTGVAGPTGGTETKPVGLVYIGCAGPKRTVVKKFQFSGDREWIRHRAALIALDLLRKEFLA